MLSSASKTSPHDSCGKFGFLFAPGNSGLFSHGRDLETGVA